MNRTDLKRGAKRWAQIPQAGGVAIVVSDGDEALEQAIDTAQVQFTRDRPNKRTVDATVITAGFRQVLAGTGALLTGANAWTVGSSYLTNVWFPYLAAAQGQDAMDSNSYRVMQQPDGSIALEFLVDTPQIGQVIRFETNNPHLVHPTDGTLTTVRAGDEPTFCILTAFYLLTMASVQAVRNTGNTGLPGDIVDRRTQSDIYKSRAADLWRIYASSVGIATGETSGGAGATVDTGAPHSAFRDLDIHAGTRIGFLWHGENWR